MNKRGKRICISKLILIILFTFNSLSLLKADNDPFREMYGRKITEIRIIGSKHTKNNTILKELVSRVGAFLEKANLHEDVRRLKNLRIFTTVKVQPQVEAGKIILVITVAEFSLFLPSIRFVITDQNGIAVGGGVRSLNLFGRAISFSGGATIGGAKTMFFDFGNPWQYNSKYTYQIEFFQRNRANKEDGYHEIATELFLSLAKNFGLKTKIGTRFWYQSIGSDTPGKTLSDDNRDNVLSLGFFAGYDSRDSSANPHSGWWNELEILKAGVFGGESDFWRANLDLRLFVPLSKNSTLSLSSLSTTSSGEIGHEIAHWQDFSIGGSNSVRGWGLGIYQGKNQFINTVEFRTTLIEPKIFEFLGFTFPLGLQMAFFGDVGTVWNKPYEFEKNLIAGVGIGIRILVPTIGMTRIDFGFGEHGFKVYLHLSSFEKATKQRFRVR